MKLHLKVKVGVQVIWLYFQLSSKKDNVVDLKEANEIGELVHKDILEKVQNAGEVNGILFNELMNMINGDLAMTHYIAQNVKRSGLEIWHKINKNNKT